MPKLSVVIPCYNEEKNLPPLFNEFPKVIGNREIQIVFVNNGSTDRSEEVFKKLTPLHSFAKLVNVENNQGYGFGIHQGLKSCDGEFLGWTHADLQTDPYDIAKAYDILVDMGSEKLYLKGKRRKRPFFDSIFTWGMSLFETAYFAVPMSDINGQPNIFHRSFFESLDEIPDDFSIEVYFLYMANIRKISLKRLSVEFKERLHGQSSWNTSFSQKWKYIKRTLSFSADLKKRTQLKKRGHNV